MQGLNPKLRGQTVLLASVSHVGTVIPDTKQSLMPFRTAFMSTSVTSSEFLITSQGEKGKATIT